VAGPKPPEPVDTDFGIDAVRENPPPLPSPLGAGHLILVARELSGLSQRVLARAVGTSQPTLAILETGNRTPTIRTLMRVAKATGFELVIGLRRPGAPPADPGNLHAQGFDLLGTLRPDPQDGLADFVVLREPTPFEGPR
jgi:transcriptional regulator with XRE-family HTH domain